MATFGERHCWALIAETRHWPSGHSSFAYGESICMRRPHLHAAGDARPLRITASIKRPTRNKTKLCVGEGKKKKTKRKNFEKKGGFRGFLADRVTFVDEKEKKRK